ncbi:MAG TPA: hypothetical protein VKX16_14690, partial [Chloroflexota bacterium]|nr:hypothetical protein [Chloroflexota bacterium]
KLRDLVQGMKANGHESGDGAIPETVIAAEPEIVTRTSPESPPAPPATVAEPPASDEPPGT